MIDMTHHLERSKQILKEVDHLKDLTDLSDLEEFLFKTYEPTLEISGTYKISFNLSNEDF
jgi:hypothetical protein